MEYNVKKKLLAANTLCTKHVSICGNPKVQHAHFVGKIGVTMFLESLLNE